ncbi:MAG TPA: hypothetical protein VM782_08870 [Stellaceae bacterium]|nr:hypothetical protein [Stellaceae bacterium]
MRVGDLKQNPVSIAFGIEEDSGVICRSHGILSALALDPRWPADKAATPAVDGIAGAPEDLKEAETAFGGIRGLDDPSRDGSRFS